MDLLFKYDLNLYYRDHFIGNRKTRQGYRKLNRRFFKLPTNNYSNKYLGGLETRIKMWNKYDKKFLTCKKCKYRLYVHICEDCFNRWNSNYKYLLNKINIKYVDGEIKYKDNGFADFDYANFLSRLMDVKWRESDLISQFIKYNKNNLPYDFMNMVFMYNNNDYYYFKLGFKCNMTLNPELYKIYNGNKLLKPKSYKIINGFIRKILRRFLINDVIKIVHVYLFGF